MTLVSADTSRWSEALGLHRTTATSELPTGVGCATHAGRFDGAPFLRARVPAPLAKRSRGAKHTLQAR